MFLRVVPCAEFSVKFEQVEELDRMLDNIEAHGLYVRMFRAEEQVIDRYNQRGSDTIKS